MAFGTLCSVVQGSLKGLVRARFALCSLIALLGCVGVAQASVQIISAPTDVLNGASGTGESDTTIFGFQEQTGILTDQAVNHLVSGTQTNIPGGQSPGIVTATFDSWFFHFDPVSATGDGNPVRSATGSITFTQNILGLIFLSADLTATDATLGLSPTTTYPNTPATGSASRGLELSGANIDRLIASVGNDQRTLDFDILLANSSGVDQVRVLVATGAGVVPEATSLVAWSFLSLGGVLGLRPARNA